jgi:hypothetical protein
MANTILLKKSSTANAQPTTGQLAAGELAINTADGRLFAKNAAGTAVVNLPVSSISGQAITPGKLTTTTANSATTGEGQIYLNGATGNRIDFNANGVGLPALFQNTRSAGAKICLAPSTATGQTDYAIGLGTNMFWQSVPTTTQSFKWYAGTTSVATLVGDGGFYAGYGTFTTNVTAPWMKLNGASTGGDQQIGIIEFYNDSASYGDTSGFISCYTATGSQEEHRLRFGVNSNQIMMLMGSEGIAINPPDGTTAINSALEVYGNLALNGGSGSLNCMYIYAGAEIGGAISTDTLTINQNIGNLIGGLGAISFNDFDNSPSFWLDADGGLTLYASYGSPGGDDYPAAGSAILSASRYEGVINVWRLNVDNGGIVSPGNAKKPGIQSPQTGLFLWQNFR